ncbi:DUF3440 domain-containing protein [Erwinia tasmaniensis]|uniref:DUF3440 domain-containing protein n=1 Tax=Erwinia tasmaniensis TaxID=338565 RepID=UPI003A4DCBF8
MMKTIPLGKSVFNATVERTNWLFDTFPSVCLFFSGGKNSSVLLHITADIARSLKRKFTVLFIDWEVQYSDTITHVSRMKTCYSDVIEKFYWVALPMTALNSTSQHQPLWLPWDRTVEWVRHPPLDAITDESFFPFYYYGMDCEEFVAKFGKWFANNASAVILMGIRTEDSLNCYRTITSGRKMRFMDDKPWTTASKFGFCYYAYPLYDWKIKDIWLYYFREKKPFNPVYEQMYKAGVSPKNMRISVPYAGAQRQNLWLLAVVDPGIWSKASKRVMGASTGALYGRKKSPFYAQKDFAKPKNLSWKAYALLLIKTLPPTTAEHYRNKIFVYLSCYQKKGFPDSIPEEQEYDLGLKDIPSWKRICSCILKNDYWCRTLSFSPTKISTYATYSKRIKAKREKWRLL